MGFTVATAGAEGAGELRARSVIVASGILNVPRLPPIAAALPPGLPQVTAADYRAPADLPTGAVLVVGSAQTGVQLAEDLVAAGRRTFLCTSSVGRIPRRYRGRDIFAWLGDAGFFEQTPDALPDPAMLRWPQPQVSGVGPLGRTVSLQCLAAQGVTLLGRPVAVEGDRVRSTTPSARTSRSATGSRPRPGDWSTATSTGPGSGAEATETTRPTIAHPDPASVHSPAALDLEAARDRQRRLDDGLRRRTSAICRRAPWTRSGVPIHDRGVGPVAGLIFMRVPVAVKRKSGIIPGVEEDAGASPTPSHEGRPSMPADRVARDTLADRVVLITGCTGPLGRVATASFAAAGARLGLVGRTAKTRLEELAADLHLEAGRLGRGGGRPAPRRRTRPGPSPRSRSGSGGWTSSSISSAAGRAARRSPISTPGDVERMLAQHVWTTLHIARAAVPGMVERGWGRFVAISAPVAVEGASGMAAYAVAKAGEEALLRTLAKEVAGSGVTANVLVARKIDAAHERETAPSPKNASWTTPEELVAAMRYLCSDEGSAVNGVRIPLTGRS